MIILQKIFAYLLDIAQTVIIAGVLFLITYIFFFRPYQVSGSSMHPTFVDKEYVLTSIISLRIEKLKRGDVIVFQAPHQENEEFKKDYIKRIIGIAGDSVEVKNGDVYVNDQKLNESTYLASDVKTYGGAFIKEDAPVVVPQDSFIVMGDNRPASSDSREWGFVKEKEIIGKSVFVYLPINQMRFVKNPFK